MRERFKKWYVGTYETSGKTTLISQLIVGVIICIILIFIEVGSVSVGELLSHIGIVFGIFMGTSLVVDIVDLLISK